MEAKLYFNHSSYAEEQLSSDILEENISTGFKFIEINEAKEINIGEEYIDKNYLLFFIKGEFTVNCNNFHNCNFIDGEMVLLPKSSSVRLFANNYSQVLIMSFHLPESSSDKTELESLATYCKNIEYTFSAIKIRYPLPLFLETLIHCLKNEMDYAYLHSLMQREFFFLLRGFYKKREIANLFYPIIGKEIIFKDFVMENYLSVDNIGDLIALSNMGRTSFFVKFKEVFGVTAKQWMLQQTKERILRKIAEPGMNVKILMDLCGFDSNAQLYRYFKEYFNCTPKQLIAHYQAKKQAFEKKTIRPDKMR